MMKYNLKYEVKQVRTIKKKSENGNYLMIYWGC